MITAESPPLFEREKMPEQKYDCSKYIDAVKCVECKYLCPATKWTFHGICCQECGTRQKPAKTAGRWRYKVETRQTFFGKVEIYTDPDKGEFVERWPHVKVDSE